MVKALFCCAVIATVATLFFIAPCNAAIGGDVSEPYDKGTFACCVKKGWSFVIVRSYCSFGGIDSHAVGTLDAAKDGGVAYRDVYHFPCYGGVGAKAQVHDDYEHVKGHFGMMWFDIETNPSPGCHWSSNKADNCRFMKELIDAGHGLGIHMGIYASEYMWSSIMGDGCHVGAANGLALWYAHYDGTQSYSDFAAFGGWSKPSIKQYWDSVGYCGISADADWYP